MIRRKLLNFLRAKRRVIGLITLILFLIGLLSWLTCWFDGDEGILVFVLMGFAYMAGEQIGKTKGAKGREKREQDEKDHNIKPYMNKDYESIWWL